MHSQRPMAINLHSVKERHWVIPTHWHLHLVRQRQMEKGMRKD